MFWNWNDSKWFLDALGHEGLNNLLLAYDDKSAQAVCTFAYCEGPGREPIIFEGRTLVLSISVGECSIAETQEGEDCTSSGTTWLWYVSVKLSISS